MSLTLATVADALIEFILSLLRDPEVRAEFEEDPDAALAQRGLHHISPSDVQSVAPVIIERTHVVQVPVFVRHTSSEEQHHANPVVREIQQVSNHFAWVDDRDTIVDQSVNQNIWADGDVTQTFDNDAVVASGDDAIAAGAGVDVDETTDQSTTIEAGDDVNIGNDTDVTVIEDSYTDDTDESTTTDDSTDIQVDGSANDDSSAAQLADSGDDQTDDATATDSAATETAVDDSTDTQGDVPVPETQVDVTAADTPVDVPPTGDAVDSAIAQAPVAAPEPSYTDSAAQYAELDSDADANHSFDSTDSVLTEDAADDDF